VVKAKDTATSLDVAIKIIPLTDTDPSELKTIQKEIDFLSQCSHPNVVKYIVSVSYLQVLLLLLRNCIPRPSRAPFLHCCIALVTLSRFLLTLIPHLLGSFE
jgi:serine/threonine protein kinase